MHTIDQLNGLRQRMQAQANGLRAIVDRANTEATKIKADASRAANWVAERIDELRQAVVKEAGEAYRELHAGAQEARGQRAFWGSKTYVLSRQKFDADAAKDAVIRAAKLAEFSLVAPAVLQLIADDSIAVHDWPTVWQAYLAGAQHHGTEGWSGIDFAQVAIDEQAQALELISQCERLSSESEYLIATAAGRTASPVQKLAMARGTA